MIIMHLIGNLGKDCLVNDVNGKKVINFSVAHTESWTNAQGEKQQKTVWVDCAYWVEKTGIAPYLKKGTQVYVEGQPEARAYTTNDGAAHGSLTLRVRSVQLLGGNKDNAGAPNTQAQTQEGAPSLGNASFASGMSSPAGEGIDDLPF